MTAPSLLNINVDTLFEKHSVNEIEQIEKQLQIEVEKKKEELRTMVGERYRDLLKAADTIATMKDTSKSVIQQVENISINCKSLNEKQLIGFKTESAAYQSSQNRDINAYFGTVVQIKLLTDLPETIWSQLDDENFLKATQLFIFARHISTGLQIDINNTFLQHFPVAKKQWSIISPFFFTIKQNILKVLERESLSPEVATDCLLSLYLLEKSSFDEILNNFIQLRSTAYIKALAGERTEHKRVKDRILSSLKVLFSTAELIYKCLIDCENNEGKGLVILELQKLSDENGAPTLDLLELEDKEASAMLPDIISKFRPCVEIPVINSEVIENISKNWLENVANVSRNELKQLFDLIGSMKTIQDFKEDVANIEQSFEWSKMCERLHLPSTLDFYQDYYLNLVNERIRNIIEDSWTKIISETHHKIQDKVACVDVISKQRLQLWDEHVDDLPSSLKEALTQDRKSNKLLMKARGYSTDIVEICIKFDEALGTIFNDVEFLLEEKQSTLEEKQSLIEFLKTLSQEKMSDLITKIKSIEHKNLLENYILLARYLISFIELCPNLKICLSHYVPSDWGKVSSDRKNFEKWSKVCNLLNEEAFLLWKHFCDAFIEQLKINEEISSNIDVETILSDFVLWETVTVEEKDEQNNPIQSAIRIPSQPRISVQQFLFKVITSLNNVVPQSMPRKVLHYFNSKIVRNIIAIYKNYLESSFITKNQNIALQLYFDLKLIQFMFVEREDKQMQEEFQKLTSQLKNYVDPFDFELFHSYLTINVRKCASRIQHEIGILLPNLENIGVAVDSKVGGTLNQQERDPNVLCLSSNGSLTTWFPLLPIIVPTNKSQKSNLSATTDTDKTPSKLKTKKTEAVKQSNSTQQSAQNYASNVKSGAAAFFGAMSQDWFR